MPSAQPRADDGPNPEGGLESGLAAHGASADLSMQFRLELIESHGGLVLFAVAPQGHGAVRLFAFADDEQDRNLASGAVTDLAVYLVVGTVHFHSH